MSESQRCFALAFNEAARSGPALQKISTTSSFNNEHTLNHPLRLLCEASWIPKERIIRVQMTQTERRAFAWDLKICLMGHTAAKVSSLILMNLCILTQGAVQKIKRGLIQKAKLHKDLVRARAEVDHMRPTTTPYRDEVEETEPASIELHSDREFLVKPVESEPMSAEPHPDRQALMDEPEAPLPRERYQPQPKRPREWKPKTQTFGREAQEAEQRQKERDEAEATRRKKIQARQRMAKAVAKARKPGKDGKRKLGRESAVLLEKVKRMMDG
jgi:hypothetical protein